MLQFVLLLLSSEVFLLYAAAVLRLFCDQLFCFCDACWEGQGYSFFAPDLMVLNHQRQARCESML